MPDTVVVANGPSLADIDFNHFKNKLIITSNRAYLSFQKLPEVKRHIHIIVNRLVAQQFSEDIEDLNCEVYTLRRFSGYFSSASNINYLDDIPGFGFSSDMTKGVFVGATVTYVMLQLAASLGAKHIGLVGLDHSFSVTGKPHHSLPGLKDDVNHFLPNYFPKGVRWQAPDLVESDLNYMLSRIELGKLGIKVVNYSATTQLTVFDRYEYDAAEGFTDKLIKQGVIDLGSISAEIYGAGGFSMPSFSDLLDKSYIFYVMIILGFCLSGVYYLLGNLFIYVFLFFTPIFGLVLLKKSISWVKTFRRRLRLEMMFSYLSKEL